MLFNLQHRVLCIDDDEDSRVMLVTLLGLELIEAKAVGTAAQALSLMQTERFDVYLLDAWLPGLDGFELCRRMRELHPHAPILFFSGAPDEADKKKGIEAGANAYFIKPDIHGLVVGIKRFFPQAESATVKVISTRQEVSVSRPAAYEIAGV